MVNVLSDFFFLRHDDSWREDYPTAPSEYLRRFQLQMVTDRQPRITLGDCLAWPIVAREGRFEADFSITRGDKSAGKPIYTALAARRAICRDAACE